ncbi:hypothetical protein PHYBLDRAFT_168680 [Phycomyces blakesleeanus NRRL 1555(-)]|uniref:Uncharacterized protein n=1 Tax=Phycomyces blakesleeanus (strain ATCC 8743b / DSM 1359 / FGSC 10004 / NBRC 33097 / NRRL 1555) TaxID=763407 RepID=A0A162U8X2_PHYB8|nr:hypothetical protein PHYBLDRAFT_168680 [Phycomyces blakesleeanus NRRL 1555(-)]OAD73323.1 hypothetical protein PHYBLDRAFT_168680 [Phycomyces blakesleeanus NRRL 1555(-)]|eukprot:XP_018291363.1 hypothetical protein PHYBLDRAFT_168680 [Phycomyces blakesleeanus NRRL 1555(-)]
MINTKQTILMWSKIDQTHLKYGSGNAIFLLGTIAVAVAVAFGSVLELGIISIWISGQFNFFSAYLISIRNIYQVETKYCETIGCEDTPIITLLIGSIGAQNLLCEQNSQYEAST